MAKIMLFGSSSINAIPENVEESLLGLACQGHEFIVGDSNGCDKAFHMSLSRLGLIDKVTIYCINKATNNTFKAKEKQFRLDIYEEEKKALIVDTDTNEVRLELSDVETAENIFSNQEYYEFKDKEMIRDCTIAICVWDGQSKVETRCIQRLNMLDKPCYTYRL